LLFDANPQAANIHQIPHCVDVTLRQFLREKAKKKMIIKYYLQNSSEPTDVFQLELLINQHCPQKQNLWLHCPFASLVHSVVLSSESLRKLVWPTPLWHQE